MPVRASIEFEDIQGIVRFGHGKLRSAAFLLLTIREPHLAKQWLAKAPVTTAATHAPQPERALQIAFTSRGLSKLGVPNEALNAFSHEFLSGMTGSYRSRRLGDEGGNDPEKWDWGGKDAEVPDLLLLLYAQPDKLEPWHMELKDSHFDRAFSLQAELFSNDRSDTEPFGFADGISQPAIDWDGKQTTDTHRRNRYSNLVALGEFLLGYPNEYGMYTERPLLGKDLKDSDILSDAEDTPEHKDLGRNGTYLVFRQLAQDVPGFWRFVDEAAGGDASRREQLAESMVGRKRDGTPLVPISGTAIPGIPEPQRHINNFNFDGDPKGQGCPIGAHVRRANPRTGDLPPGAKGPLSRLIRILGFSAKNRNEDLITSTRFHRILRRGRAYGPPITPEAAIGETSQGEERGLFFICLGANISRQFEFVQNAWISSGKFGGLQNESDPLLGNGQALNGGSATNNFSRPTAEGPRLRTAGLPQFITVKGGAYFFLPGIRALKYIAACGPATGGEEAQP